MNRRSLFKGLAVLSTALVLPPSLEENLEEMRRYWSLDRTHLSRHHMKVRDFARWVEAKEVRHTPFTDWIQPYDATTFEVGQSYTPFADWDGDLVLPKGRSSIPMVIGRNPHA